MQGRANICQDFKVKMSASHHHNNVDQDPSMNTKLPFSHFHLNFTSVSAPCLGARFTRNEISHIPPPH